MGNTTATELEDLLARQLDALLRGADPTEELIAAFPAARELLALARRLYDALIPLQPDGGFVRELKRELVGEGRRAPARDLLATINRAPAYVKLAGAVGGIALGAGISLIALRTLIARPAGQGGNGAGEALPAPAES